MMDTPSYRDEIAYRLGRAEGLLRILVAHHDSSTSPTHAIELAREFLAEDGAT